MEKLILNFVIFYVDDHRWCKAGTMAQILCMKIQYGFKCHKVFWDLFGDDVIARTLMWFPTKPK